jgi:hypothetical protein
VNNNKGEKIGTVLATGKSEITYSLLNPEDRFSKKKGKELALARLENHKANIPYGTFDFDYWGHLIYEKARSEYRGKKLNPNWGFLLVTLLEVENRADRYFK